MSSVPERPKLAGTPDAFEAHNAVPQHRISMLALGVAASLTELQEIHQLQQRKITCWGEPQGPSGLETLPGLQGPTKLDLAREPQNPTKESDKSKAARAEKEHRWTRQA